MELGESYVISGISGRWRSAGPSVFLVIASKTLANAVQVAPSDIGTTEALLVIALRDYADASTDRAFSLAKTSILTVWNMVFGVVVPAINGISGATEIILRECQIRASTFSRSSS